MIGLGSGKPPAFQPLASANEVIRGVGCDVRESNGYTRSGVCSRDHSMRSYLKPLEKRVTSGDLDSLYLTLK